MGVAERIRGCMAVERAASDIYDIFAARFPEDAEFWELLAGEELEHELIFRHAEQYGPFEDDPGDGPELPYENLIAKTIEYLGGIFERLHGVGVVGPALTRQEAFDTALKIESLMAETYLNELKELDRTERVKGLGRVLDSERTHIEMLTQYMQERGLSRYS